MAHCDLCGGGCRANELQPLLNQYQAAGVVDVCPKCRSWADSFLNKLRAEIGPKMREAVAERKFGSTPPRRRWSIGILRL